MRKNSFLLWILLITVSLTSCGDLSKKTVLLGMGDEKQKVLKVMGTPDDRQLKGDNEAWQYCQTGAGFGYHDYAIIWFYKGKITGINSYKDRTPGSSCMVAIRPIRWEDAPDSVIEIRER